MATLEILRGVPASGKSTYAFEELRCNPDTVVVVNRDEIRFTTFGRYIDVDEDLVTRIEHAAIEAGLRAGKRVIVDATNLNRKFLSSILRIGAQYRADVTFVDFPMSLYEALRRDRWRAIDEKRHVGDAVIKKFFKRYKIHPEQGIIPQAPEVPDYGPMYVPDVTKPRLYTFDLDGTLAIHGDRSPYDTSRYMDDTPDAALRELVYSAGQTGPSIGILSGRSEEFREVCEAWLDRHNIRVEYLWMRPAGDQRSDDVIKTELFDQHIAPHFNHLAHWDDRSRVVRALRSKGVNVYQVVSDLDGGF